jgi:MFS family permease
VLIILLGVWIGAAFIPRWWAHRIGDQVQGSIPAGITLGLVYGFLFTVLPLLVLLWAGRKRRSWRAYLVFLAIAVALALPNLFTLGIVVGTGNAAHAGERTLDVEAPGFRGGSLAGAIVAALLLAGVAYLLGSRRRVREELDRLRTDAARSDPPPSTPEP